MGTGKYAALIAACQSVDKDISHMGFVTPEAVDQVRNALALPVDAEFNDLQLRDWFAVKAMQGEETKLPFDIGDEYLEKIAKHWYRIADFMLKARQA